jgi:hypothetical protein
MKQRHDTPSLIFNNCRNFPHCEEYWPDAFFDLGTSGIQANQATELEPGQLCIVATSEDDGRVGFTAYRFQAVRRKRGVRVFCGKKVGPKQVVSRARAKRHVLYGRILNSNWHFKRQSTIRLPG